MVEVTFLIDDIDYSDRLDSQLPLVFETMSKNGDLNPVLKAACKSPEATAKVVKTLLKAMTKSQKEKLACKLLSSQREKLMRKMNQLASDYGIVATLKDCKAVVK